MNSLNSQHHFRPSKEELQEILEEIDEDGSGAIEFGEFAQLCAKFLVEVSAAMSGDFEKTSLESLKAQF